MKKLLFTLPILFSVNTYANSSIDAVKQIVALAESGEIFNLTKTAESLNLKDEIYRAEYKPVANRNSIIYNFPIHTHQVIEFISYDVSFGGLGNYDLTTVYKNVRITFKKEHCPSIDELQTVFGEKLMASEWGSPPSLQIGQNGSRQGVRYESDGFNWHDIISARQGVMRYERYHIRTSNQLIFVENNGCEFSVSGRAEEFK